MILVAFLERFCSEVRRIDAHVIGRGRRARCGGLLDCERSGPLSTGRPCVRSTVYDGWLRGHLCRTFSRETGHV